MSTPNATPNQDVPTWAVINKRQALINKITLAQLAEKKRRHPDDLDLRMRRAAAEDTAFILAKYVRDGILDPSEVPA